MKELQFTLVTDGPSDGEMLIPILEWLLRTHCGHLGVKVVHADPWRCRKVPKRLEKKIEYALTNYRCNGLFIHRDAENAEPDARRTEIQKAIDFLEVKVQVPHVCVVPIRMTEAWLLFDEAAIRLASGNPNGKVPLEIPRLKDVESEPDPKGLLHDFLTIASELGGRRRKSFDPKSKTRLVARYLDDFSALRHLSAFRELESDVQRIVKEKGWDTPEERETSTAS